MARVEQIDHNELAIPHFPLASNCALRVALALALTTTQHRYTAGCAFGHKGRLRMATLHMIWLRFLVPLAASHMIWFCFLALMALGSLERHQVPQHATSKQTCLSLTATPYSYMVLAIASLRDHSGSIAKVLISSFANRHACAMTSASGLISMKPLAVVAGSASPQTTMHGLLQSRTSSNFSRAKKALDFQGHLALPLQHAM
mmetsp:Transcript_77023/g.146568  ORF Transcript_77023/g.146568 Transcript_77023/m.146568 type:complete len:202 (-) Transcript_77023:705-1310(-)